MKIIVCGATGYVGSRLVARAAGSFEVLSTSSRPAAGTLALDLARPDDFATAGIAAGDVFVLAAAISSPDICSREHDRAWGVNVSGTLRVIERVRERGARVVFFASDTVYGERPEPFDEQAPCQPAGEYAVMKHEIEHRIAGDAGCKSLRLSYVFSAADRFTRYLQDCAVSGKPAEIFHPFIRAVVHREDVVDGVLALARRWDEFPQAIFNFGGPAAISRVAYAETLRDVAWPALALQIVTPEPAFFQNRPRSIAMRSPGLAALLGRAPHSLPEAAARELLHPGDST